MKTRLGRIQRQIRGALIAAGGMPVRTRQLLRWCYPHVKQFEWRHRSSMHRAVHEFAVNVKRGLWAPNDELAERIPQSATEIIVEICELAILPISLTIDRAQNRVQRNVIT